MQFGPKFKLHVIEDNYQQSKLKSFESKDEVVSEASAAQQIASTIWQPYILSDIDYNDAVIDVIATAQQEIFTCSKRISWVPDPTFVYPLPLATLKDVRKYLVKYVKMVVDNNRKISNNQRYKICIDTAALNYKSALLDASYNLM